jgi:hypothetical protein
MRHYRLPLLVGSRTRDRHHALANVQVEPLDKGGMNLPATVSQAVLDHLTRAEHHPVLVPDHALTAVLLDDLGAEQLKIRLPWLSPEFL